MYNVLVLGTYGWDVSVR